MNRKLIIAIVTVAIFFIGGSAWYWLKSATPPKRITFKTQEECEKITEKKCSFGMCDYKCPNNDYWEGWVPTGEKINKAVCDYDNPNKKYFYKTINECSVVKYKCEEGRPFSDDCGCGCEKAKEENVDISTGGEELNKECEKWNNDLLEKDRLNYVEKNGCIYFENKLIEGIDYTTFENLGHQYGKNKDFVFYQWHVRKEISTSSFEVLDSDFAKDNENAYFMGEKIYGFDPASFKFLSNIFARDNKNVYWGKNRIQEADVNTFKVINNDYSQDKNYLFYQNNILSSDWYGHLDNLVVLRDGYVKYFDNIYYNGKLIQEADVNSFEVIKDRYAKDKLYAYYQGNRLNELGSEGFEILSWGYSKDNNFVYFFDKKIIGADSITFKVLGYGKAEDKYYNYENGKMVN